MRLPILSMVLLMSLPAAADPPIVAVPSATPGPTGNAAATAVAATPAPATTAPAPCQCPE